MNVKPDMRDKPHGVASRSLQAAGFNPRGRSITPAASEDAGLTAILSPPLAGDIEAIARWYPKAIVLAGSPAPLRDLFDSTDRRRTLVLTDGTRQEPVGLVVVAVNDPEPGWATVALLAIARQEEREIAALGVALLEAHLRGEAGHIRAAVPLDMGLALYFWLRLGYRPAPSEPTADERFWMIRDLDD